MRRCAVSRVFLSYLLGDGDVVWPGEPTVHIEPFTTIERDGYNSCKTILPNHHGTHCDGPDHFNPNGPKLNDLPISYFWFDRVAAVDIPKKGGKPCCPMICGPMRQPSRTRTFCF